jgi:hypothetical protein
LPDETDDVLRIVIAIWIACNAGAVVGADLVLVDDPVEGGAVAEAIVEDFIGDAGEGEGVVDFDFGFVFGESHFFDAVGEGEAGGFDPFEVVGFGGFVVEVEVGELFASAGEGVERGGPTDTIGGLLERRGEGDAGELAFEVVGELGAVGGVVEEGEFTISRQVPV